MSLNSNTPTIRTTKVEIQNRVDIVIELLAKKLTRAQIHHYLDDHHSEWGVKGVTYDRYLKIARDQMVDQLRATKDELRGEAVNDMRFLLKKAMEAEDWDLARRIRKDINDFMNLKFVVIEETTPVNATGEELPKEVEDMFTADYEVVNTPE